MRVLKKIEYIKIVDVNFRTVFFAIFSFSDLNPGKGHFAYPYDSTQGVPPVFGFIAIGILAYLVIRVWWALRKEK